MERENFPEPSAAWTASTRKRNKLGVPSMGSTSTFPTRSRSRISIWRTNLFWPTECSHRSLTKALSLINTLLQLEADSSVNVPTAQWGCEGAPGDQVATITQQRTFGAGQRPCFDYQTLGDEFDAAGLSWHFYTSKYSKPMGGFWSSYQAVKHIFNGPDWHKDITTPQKKFLTDIAAGKLSSFTWITPLCADSDHMACGGGFGPSWVTSLVNAVGESKFWNSTVVFVQWDDWGGVYDRVPPPHRGYDGVGFRVPLIVISPYAKKNYVSHVQYETASVLRFAEDLFGLPQLAKADLRATSPAADCFDFSKKPRRFVPITAPEGPDFFLRQPNDDRIPDSE